MKTPIILTITLLSIGLVYSTWINNENVASQQPAFAFTYTSKTADFFDDIVTKS